MEKPLVKHGMHYGLAVQRREGQGSPAQPLCGEGDWVAEQMGAAQPLRHRATAADVDVLLAAPADTTPAQLSDTALARGLQLPPAAAERFVETALSDEAARLALAEAGYRELQQQLRTRVAPPQVREVTMPQRGETVGSGVLPGPHPGMAVQELRPAQLAAVAEVEEEGMAEGEGEGGAEPQARKQERDQRMNDAALAYLGLPLSNDPHYKRPTDEQWARWRGRSRHGDRKKPKLSAEAMNASDVLRADLRNGR